MSQLGTKQKILIVVVVSSTLGVLVSVLALIWTMPDIPTTVITDEICLPDRSMALRCGKTVKRLLQYTQSVSSFSSLAFVSVSYDRSMQSIYRHHSVLRKYIPRMTMVNKTHINVQVMLGYVGL